MGIKKSILLRSRIAFSAVVLFALAIIGQGARMQLTQGEFYRAKADSVYVKYVSIEAERGNIYASGGEQLVASLPYFQISMDPTVASDETFRKGIDSLAWHLARVLGDRDRYGYKRLLIDARENKRQYVLLDRKVTYPELESIRQFPILRLGRYRGGLLVEPFNRRDQPYGELAKRTIGYVNDEKQVGLEGSFNEELAGQDGQRLMQKISGGNWIPLNDGNEIEPRHGQDLITTLDIGVQDVAETALEQAMVKHEANWGTAIVMEVQTGAIKAIANLQKTKDRSGNTVYKEEYNYAVGGRTEPGSTFKLASVLALIEDDKSHLEEMVDLNGGHMVYRRQHMWDSEGRHGIREVPMMRAFWRSSNVGISKLVDRHYRHHEDIYIKRLKQFGLTQSTGIEIYGERSPYIKSDPTNSNEWSAVTLPWMSIGYEVEITPLQLLTFYNTVANDGHRVKPFLVDEIRERGQVVHNFKPEVDRQRIASPRSIQEVQKLLQMVVDSGTARNIRSPYYKIAGKTGTSQVADATTSYDDKVYQSSFVGYFPAEKPLYSICVVIHGPSNGDYYGAVVAGPVFKAISDRLFATDLQIHDPINVGAPVQTASAKGWQPDLRTVYAGLGIDFPEVSDTDWVRATAESENTKETEQGILAIRGLDYSEARLPDVRGMGLRDALFLLENAGWKVQHSGLGKVRSIRREGETVHLVTGHQ